MLNLIVASVALDAFRLEASRIKAGSGEVAKRINAVEKAFSRAATGQYSLASYKIVVSRGRSGFQGEVLHDGESEFKDIPRKLKLNSLVYAKSVFELAKPILRQCQFRIDSVYFIACDFELRPTRYPTVILRFYNRDQGLTVATIGDNPFHPLRPVGISAFSRRGSHVD